MQRVTLIIHCQKYITKLSTEIDTVGPAMTKMYEPQKLLRCTMHVFKLKISANILLVESGGYRVDTPGNRIIIIYS